MTTLARISFLLFLLLPCLLGATPQAQTQSFRVAPSYFPNKGQVSDKSVTWYSRGANVSLYLRGTTLTYVLHHRPKATADDFMNRPHEMDETASIVDRVDVELVGANPRYKIQAEAKQAGVFHFYLPQCSPGLRDVPHYGRVVCRDVWPGVDLVLGAQGDALKYDFVVKPGADAGQIRLRYGGQGPNLTPDGGLTRPTAAGDLRESAPTAWTTAPDGSRTPVAASWQLAEYGQPSFALGAYDATQPLTIDPVVWGKYVGGGSWDVVEVLCSSDDGGGYMGGWAGIYSPNSNNFNGIKGAIRGVRDGFLLRFSASGDLIWGSFVGGSFEDAVRALCPAPDGGVYAGGATESDDFARLDGSFAGGRSDAFLIHFSNAGVLVRGRFFGGEGNESVFALCPAPDGGIFAGGETESSGIDSIRGEFKRGTDAFLLRMNFKGSMMWGTYLGGSGSDAVWGLSATPDGGVYLGGRTSSGDFKPLLSHSLLGLEDGFLMKFSPLGDLIWGFCVGGSGKDGIHALCPGPDGGVYTGGWTESDDFQNLKDGYKGNGDAFIARFSASGGMIWGVSCGGSMGDQIFALCSAPNGGVYVSGITWSDNFVGLVGVFKGSARYSWWNYDSFLARFLDDGSMVFGTYLGGTVAEQAIALCPAPYGGVFVGGHTNSVDFEQIHESYRGGMSDGFLLYHTGDLTTRPAPQAPLPLSLAPNPASNQAPIDVSLDTGGSATLEAYDTAGRLIHSRRIDLQAGDNRLDLDLSDWPVGIYSVYLKMEGKEYAGRLVKN